MLEAVRAGLFVAIYASCILPLLASVLLAASAIIWREFLTKRGETAAAERQASLGVTQSTASLHRITAATKKPLRAATPQS